MNYKIGIIIPDRNDRPNFLENCRRMIKAQTFREGINHIKSILVVSDPAENDECDITKRYKKGYDKLSSGLLGFEFDIIFLMENDDYYHPDYMQAMLDAWETAGRPDIFGTNYTYYYHIGIKKYFKLTHTTRASAMNTMIKPGLNFKWCPDNEPYTDIHLWETIKNKDLFGPEKIISIGIKHGIGKCGGKCHTDRLGKYTENDKDFSFLKEVMKDDNESFEFYSKVFAYAD